MYNEIENKWIIDSIKPNLVLKENWKEKKTNQEKNKRNYQIENLNMGHYYIFYRFKIIKQGYNGQLYTKMDKIL